MTIHHARLNKKTLETVPPQERQLFLSVAHLANEINALQKCLLWSSDFSSDNDAVRHGQVSLSFLFLRLLAGKLTEANKMLRQKFYHSGLSREYWPSLSIETVEVMKKIKGYFDRDNKVDFIRNNYAFHYSPDTVDAALPGLPDDLDVYIGDDGRGNSLYYFAEVLVAQSLFRAVDGSMVENALKMIVNEIVPVARWMLTAAEGLLVAFVSRHQKEALWDGFAEPITVGEFKPLQEVRLPWFTDFKDIQRCSKSL